jgi:hypothetical protein
MMERTPNQTMVDSQLDSVELDPTTGMGIEVGYKHDPSKFLYDKDYNTRLSPKLEEEYKKVFKPEDSTDYDMRGWFFEQFMNNPLVIPSPNKEGAHYPDTYKKPNHPTFSMDSRYNGVNGNYGGVWGEEEGKDTFKPSSTNLKNLGKEGLQDYFKRVEPNAKLLLDEPQIEDRRDDTNLRTYQEILDGEKRGSTYSSEDNKSLDRPYTKLEKEAGMNDIDKIELDSMVNLIRRGLAAIEQDKKQNLSGKK